MKPLKFVNILTNWSSVVWGMDGLICQVSAWLRVKVIKNVLTNILTNILTLIFVVLSSAKTTEVLGGPTQPPSDLESQQGLVALTPQSSGLEERSPDIQDVIVRMGDPFIEVYLKASGGLNCFDIREYTVERLQDKTVIIPVLRRSKPLTPCEPIRKNFEDKVADLDPNLDSAYLLEVLGFKGWHRRELARP